LELSVRWYAVAYILDVYIECLPRLSWKSSRQPSKHCNTSANKDNNTSLPLWLDSLPFMLTCLMISSTVNSYPRGRFGLLRSYQPRALKHHYSAGSSIQFWIPVTQAGGNMRHFHTFGVKGLALVQSSVQMGLLRYGDKEFHPESKLIYRVQTFTRHSQLRGSHSLSTE
jgi:hypothetical protein